ncbi:MAG: GNAT family N-acetyltransferase [Ruminococcus sp.]|nr:GNAT family N-acetyltransferase [Ruminococcus sp.]
MSIFSIPTIETERLILRPLTVDDAEAVFAWTGDERVAKYMLYTVNPDVNAAREWLGSLEKLENEYTWGIVRKSDSLLIGASSIRLHTDDGSWSFGYNIRYDCWNNGYATEATLRMMEYVRRNHNAKHFTAEHAAENAASGRVIEKCGLHYIRDGEYSSFDGTRTFKSKIYVLNEGE